MGSRDCFLGLSLGNPEHRVPMVQQCIRSAKHRGWGMFPSAPDEVAAVETLSLRCCQGVRVRETRPSLRLNVC